jgi:hypothetical protein
MKLNSALQLIQEMAAANLEEFLDKKKTRGVTIQKTEIGNAIVTIHSSKGSPVGTIHLELIKKGPLEGMFASHSKAKHGFGPPAYDIAIEYATREGSGVVPAAGAGIFTTGEAESVWKHYYEQRRDVEHQPIPDAAYFSEKMREEKPWLYSVYKKMPTMINNIKIKEMDNDDIEKTTFMMNLGKLGMMIDGDKVAEELGTDEAASAEDIIEMVKRRTKVFPYYFGMIGVISFLNKMEGLPDKMKPSEIPLIAKKKEKEYRLKLRKMHL